jgi:hypothetical protein
LPWRTEDKEEKRESIKSMLLPRSASRTSRIHVYTLTPCPFEPEEGAGKLEKFVDVLFPSVTWYFWYSPMRQRKKLLPAAVVS